MNFAKVLGVDQLRQPADELGQDGVAHHPAVKSQASQNLDQHQQVDDEVGQRGQGIMTYPMAGLET